MALRTEKRRSGSSCWGPMLHAAGRSRLAHGGARFSCTTRLVQHAAARVYGTISAAGATIFCREPGMRDRDEAKEFMRVAALTKARRSGICAAECD